MKFKKLTLAAAISIGLASVATVGAFADNVQQLASCGCAQEPVVVSPACPCQLESPCCEEAKPACDCAPACDPCPACPTCDPCPACEKPVCGSAPNVCEKAKPGSMHYAYPQSVFSGNNSVHADPFNIGLSPEKGVMVSRGESCGCQIPETSCGCAAPVSNCGCGSTVTTGSACDCAATPTMPCISDSICAPVCGTTVNRDCNKIEGACCPIEIKTETSMQAMKKTLDPFQVPVTGCATPVAVSSVFNDVPEGFWANCDINKLVSKNVIAGYPDRTFKPTLPVSRAEFASLIANGLELSRCCKSNCAAFCDVSGDHWANSSIQRAVEAGYMAGYPDNTFKPSIPVSRAEAITTIAKAFKCDLGCCDIDKVLAQYADGCKVPDWAKGSVAKALNNGLLQDTLTPNQIKPCEDASRADVASMLSQARLALCIDKAEPTGCACDNKQTAYMEKCETVDIPTLKVQFGDRISAAASDIGDRIAGKTIDPVVINGVTYPANSKVKGIVTDVERPYGDCPGGLKISLTDIENGTCDAKLPRQILNAQVECTKNQNWFSRAIQMPFTLVGSTMGIAGRTVGGILINTANAAESATNNVGIGTGELFSFSKPACSCGDSVNKFTAAGRSYGDAIVEIAKAPVDILRTSISGTAGVLQNANDELGYLVNPDGKKISIINPDEKVSFAFGVNSSTAAQPSCACPCEPKCDCDCK
jgi:hypothetical protein